MIHRLMRIDYINFTLHWRGGWNSIIFWGYSFIVFPLQKFTRIFPMIFTFCVQWITLVFCVWFLWLAILSLLFSRSVVSDSLQPHGLQQAIASLFLTISQSLLKLTSTESVMPSKHLILCSPFSCLQPFPASGFFPMSRFTASGGQSTGVLASASVLPMNNQGWFPLGLTGWLSL